MNFWKRKVGLMFFGSMINNLIEGLQAFKNVISFSSMPKEKRTVTFYCENANYYPHLELLLETILNKTSLNVCYVSSSRDDPGLGISHPKLECFFIGYGFMRNYFFEKLNTKLLILTMPDLGNFQIKRSNSDVHYAYTQHSLVSTHMIYRDKAFDHYDSILCAGPHHVVELEKAENLYSLKKKNLVEFGYPILDRLLDKVDENKKEMQTSVTNKNKLKILIAPSWGPEGIIESGICLKIIKDLLKLEHAVIVRPHPQTLIFNSEMVSEIRNTFLHSDKVSVEVDVQGHESLLQSDLMISDWSGVALEYAFGFKKPVIFCDIPKKINNPKYLELGIIPLEEQIRSKVGTIWDTNSSIGEAIENCKSCFNYDQLELLSKKYIYNIKRSDQAFINFLKSLDFI